jgi:hypothetical protein
MAKKVKKGWHPDPRDPGRERFWDGQAWTEQYRDVPPPRRRRRAATMLKVGAGVVLGGCVLIAGCAALVGAGLNSEEKDGITRVQFDSIAQGTRQADVEDRLGEPEDSQDFESRVPELQDEASHSSCIYYREKGKKILEGQSFQLCFDDGKLTAKNAY